MNRSWYPCRIGVSMELPSRSYSTRSAAVTSAGARSRERKKRSGRRSLRTLMWPMPSRIPSVARMRLPTTRSSRICRAAGAAAPRPLCDALVCVVMMPATARAAAAQEIMRVVIHSSRSSLMRALARRSRHRRRATAAAGAGCERPSRYGVYGRAAARTGLFLSDNSIESDPIKSYRYSRRTRGVERGGIGYTAVVSLRTDPAIAAAIGLGPLRTLSSSTLDRLLANAMTLDVPRGVVVQTQGSSDIHAGLLVSGLLRAFRTTGDGRQ